MVINVVDLLMYSISALDAFPLSIDIAMYV